MKTIVAKPFFIVNTEGAYQAAFSRLDFEVIVKVKPSNPSIGLSYKKNRDHVRFGFHPESGHADSSGAQPSQDCDRRARHLPTSKRF